MGLAAERPAGLMPNALKIAKDLAARGMPVFPCVPRGKVPATSNGFKAATTDEGRIDELFAGREYNIGVATGYTFWTLDVDGPDGEKYLQELEDQHGPLPQTVTVKTGNGRHYYFRSNGHVVKNRSKINGRGLDTRGKGGYVLAAGSIHPSGTTYELESDLDSTPISEAPKWLLDLVVNRQRPSVNNGRKPWRAGEPE